MNKSIKEDKENEAIMSSVTTRNKKYDGEMNGSDKLSKDGQKRNNSSNGSS